MKKVLFAGYYGPKVFGEDQERDLSLGKIYTSLDDIKSLGFVGDAFTEYARDNSLDEDNINEIVNYVGNDTLAFAIAFDTVKEAKDRLNQEIEWTKDNEARYTEFVGTVDNQYGGTFDWYCEEA